MAKTDGRFSAQEREAMKTRAAELRADAQRTKGAARAAAEEEDHRAKIAGMPDGDREMAERLHAIVTEAAPDLAPKLYYGQPGYARDGDIVIFFRSGQMDKQRYSTLGLSVRANVDDPSGFWPTSYALTNPSEEAWAEITEIVRRAAQPKAS